MTDSRRPTCRGDFHVAIICALASEADAVTLLFDEFWDDEGTDPFGRASGDHNFYTTGRIDKHDVVLLDLDGMGTISATSGAAGLRASYNNLKLVLVVGICGGMPKIEGCEAILGDVVISKTIKQYDYGRQYPQGFKTKDGVEDTLGRAPKDIRNLLATLTKEFERKRLQKRAVQHLEALKVAAVKERRRADYRYPGASEDRLFASEYAHVHRGSCTACSQGEVCSLASETSCSDIRCEQSNLISRDRLNQAEAETPQPEIFIGAIASGNAVMKSGKDRERLSKELGGDVVAFEMEGAGVWDELPCLVVKGICDYADSHKNKRWQSYVSATAAAVAKAVLQRYVIHDNPQPTRTGKQLSSTH